ncbi:MAG: T9SS type A sorting domain-containing protein, partial [Bacteroidota bacterium]
DIPGAVRLDQNYPNPFNPATVIRFQLPETSDVTLEVFNMLGQRVSLLADGRMTAGEHEVSWDATGMASGLYLYRLTSSDVSLTRRMMLVK